MNKYALMSKKEKQKHLCKLEKKEIKEQFDRIVSLVTHPLFICEKCARSANTEAVLCKAVKF